MPARLNFAKQILAGEISLSQELFFGKDHLFFNVRRIIFGEKGPGDMEYSVSYEKSRKNIDGIMQVSQKDGCAEKQSRGQEYFSQAFVFPIYETHEKRKARMGRKEKIVLGGESFV